MQQVFKVTENLVFNEAPKFIKQLQNPQAMQRNIQQGIELNAWGRRVAFHIVS